MLASKVQKKKKGSKVQGHPSYRTKLKPPWAIQGPISKKKKEKEVPAR